MLIYMPRAEKVEQQRKGSSELDQSEPLLGEL